MGMQKVEFEFPEPDENAGNDESFVLEIEGRESEKEGTKPELKSVRPEKEAVDIEVVDDTPPEDRGRKASEPPEDVTDDELENYSEKVRKRMKGKISIMGGLSYGE